MNDNKTYNFKFYVAGVTLEHQGAALALKNSLKEKTQDDYDLEVVDLLVRPEVGVEDKVLATPSIKRMQPEPLITVLLDVTQKDSLLVGMNLLFEEG